MTHASTHVKTAPKDTHTVMGIVKKNAYLMKIDQKGLLETLTLMTLEKLKTHSIEKAE